MVALGWIELGCVVLCCSVLCWGEWDRMQCNAIMCDAMMCDAMWCDNVRWVVISWVECATWKNQLYFDEASTKSILMSEDSWCCIWKIGELENDGISIFVPEKGLPLTRLEIMYTKVTGYCKNNNKSIDTFKPICVKFSLAEMVMKQHD